MKKSACAWIGAILGVAAGLCTTSTWAINKCTAPDGKITFQDKPCVGQGEVFDARPSVVVVPTAAAPSASTPATATTATPTAIVAPTAPPKSPSTPPKEGIFGESWQRRTYLENRGVADAQDALFQHQKACEKKMARLRAEKLSQGRPDDLTSATYLQSLSAQMQAEATMCDIRERELLNEQQNLEKELQRLQRTR